MSSCVVFSLSVFFIQSLSFTCYIFDHSTHLQVLLDNACPSTCIYLFLWLGYRYVMKQHIILLVIRLLNLNKDARVITSDLNLKAYIAWFINGTFFFFTLTIRRMCIVRSNIWLQNSSKKYVYSYPGKFADLNICLKFGKLILCINIYECFDRFMIINMYGYIC